MDKNVRLLEHFSYFDWNSAKKLQKVFFIFTWSHFFRKNLNMLFFAEMLCYKGRQARGQRDFVILVNLKP